MGISAIFGFAAAAYAILLPLSYFLVLESGYFERQDGLQSDTTHDSSVQKGSEWCEDDLKVAVNTPAKKPYRQQLALFRGRLSANKFWFGSLKPLCLMISPIIFYSSLLFTVFFILLVGTSILASVILSAAPYNLSPSEIGLTNLPQVIVVMFGGPLIGWLSDVTVRYMAKSNGTNPGVAEPEFRLVLLLLCVPIAVVGLVGLGLSIDQGLPLMWVIIWLSVISLGSVTSTQVAITYVVDCFPDQSGQAFASVNAVAALVIFVGSGPAIEWLAVSGALVVFSVLASASVIISGLAIPIYVFGKRIRGAFARAAWVQPLLH